MKRNGLTLTLTEGAGLEARLTEERKEHFDAETRPLARDKRPKKCVIATLTEVDDHGTTR